MRSYGIILHISSLPSAWGIGDMGPAAHAFANILADSGAGYWQFLPLHPTSPFIGNSPYSSPSAFAGNPLFISPDFLVRDKYLSLADVYSLGLQAQGDEGSADETKVDYVSVTVQRRQLLHAAFERSSHLLQSNDDFQSFCQKEAYWLDDYARFVSLKDAYGGMSWVDWPEELAHRKPEALAQWDMDAHRGILKEKFVQYLFYSQWQALHRACNTRGIRLLADIPIYVTYDSADVWSHPEYFLLCENYKPNKVAGVPPDYFSETGQRWGNPLYNWEKLGEDSFIWWKNRLGHVLDMADVARLDHFRGFMGYWEIPEEEEYAVNGQWQPAPGKAFFKEIQEHFGGLPFIAEDLGLITEDVREVMRDFDMPGMHVLQFAFSGEDFVDCEDLPHAYGRKTTVYTATHDNNTTFGWFRNEAEELEKKNLADYYGSSIYTESVVQALTRLAFASVADDAFLPMQDVLQLDEWARMNTPGRAIGNWTWRMTKEQMNPEAFIWVKEMARLYGRLRK